MHTSGSLASIWRTKLLPIKPAPPVTRILRGSKSVIISQRSQGLIKGFSPGFYTQIKGAFNLCCV